MEGETELDNETISAIICAPLAIPLEASQIALPPLVQLTQTEINDFFSKYLKQEESPIESQDTIYSFPFKIPFDIDEDLMIYTHIKNKSESLLDFIKRANGIIKPHRTAKEIQERIDELKLQDEAPILDRIAEELMLEQLLYYSQTSEHDKIEELEKLRLKQSHFDQCRCAVDITPRAPVCEEAINEVQQATETLPLIAQSKFQPNDLAMLRSEENCYFIRQAAVLLGRNTDKNEVDIDVSYNTDPHCPHISRNQAILSFQPDFNFYIENIGIRPFRINGELLPPGFSCILPGGALLDFSGALFLFLPNEDLIQTLKSHA